MNTKIAIAIAALTSLLGCSTPHPVQTTQPGTPPPLLSDIAPGYELREGQLVPRVLIPPQICKLGTSCLAMDPRPFEPCLLSTKHCSRQGRRAAAGRTDAIDHPRTPRGVSLTRSAVAASCG